MASTRTPQVLFIEQQRFTQWWLWLILAGIVALQFWMFVEQIVLHRPFGNNPAPDWAVILLVVLFGFGMPLLMLSIRLFVVVRSDGLLIQYFPFQLRPRMIGYQNIKSCAAVRYNPLLEYGGWGIRFGRGGMAYNVTGNLGVRIEFPTGQNLLIGSRRPDELAAAINAALRQSATKR